MAQFTTIKGAVHIITPAHLYTPTPSQLLNGAYNLDTGYKQWVISVQ